MSFRSCSDRHMGYTQARIGDESKHRQAEGWQVSAQRESAGEKEIRIKTSSVSCIRQLEMINFFSQVLRFD